MTKKQYARQYEIEKKRYAQIDREIFKFLAGHNLKIDITDKEYIVTRPKLPDTLEKYIALQEFLESGKVILG